MAQEKGAHTWAHEARCPTRRGRLLARRRKAKVRNEHIELSALRRNQDVLWLQIPMVHPARVAVLEGIDDLNEYALDQLVVSEECEVSDDGVEIAGAEVVDEEGVFAGINLAMEGEDMWVGRYSSVERRFARLMVVRAGLPYVLDRIGRSRFGVDGTIDNAESSRTQDFLDQERAVVNCLTQEPGRRQRV